MGERVRSVLGRTPPNTGKSSSRRRVNRSATVRKVTRLPRTPERVWKALTDADEVSRWLLPVSEDIVPKVGHRFTFTDPGGHPVSCEVVEAIPARRLAYTWQATPDAPSTLVTWTLHPLETGTELTLEHIGQPAFGLLGLRASLASQTLSQPNRTRRRRTKTTYQHINGELKPCLWYQWSWRKCRSANAPSTFTPVC